MFFAYTLVAATRSAAQGWCYATADSAPEGFEPRLATTHNETKRSALPGSAKAAESLFIFGALLLGDSRIACIAFGKAMPEEAKRAKQNRTEWIGSNEFNSLPPRRRSEAKRSEQNRRTESPIICGLAPPCPEAQHSRFCWAILPCPAALRFFFARFCFCFGLPSRRTESRGKAAEPEEETRGRARHCAHK